MSYGVAGIILAGGQSRRFGTSKAFAQIDGVPFYRYSINAMNSIAEFIVLVTNNEISSKFNINESHIKIITDQPTYMGLGPLAGIYSGMVSIEAEWYLISPIDVPFMKESVYRTLLQHANVGKEVIVPIVEGRLQPLISVFHRSMRNKIKVQLNNNELSPRQLFIKSNVSYIDMDDEKPFRNINYQEDLSNYLQEEDK